MRKTTSVESLLLSRLTPPVALVRERRSAPASAGGAISPPLFPTPPVKDPAITEESTVAAAIDEVQRRKKPIRRKAREARRSLNPDERRDASARIAATVVHSHFFRRSRRIACYLPMPEEVDTWPIIARAWRMKKRIFAPMLAPDRLLRFREVRPDTTLVTTGYGLQEPLTGDEVGARELDLVITPLVAFDSQANRIGMAGGYYDRTFAFLRGRTSLKRPKLVGVAFACQEAEKIPLNPWDISLYRVITERS